MSSVLGKKDGKVDQTIADMLDEWKKQRSLYLDGVITKDEYDEWRYHYPASSGSGQWKKVPDILNDLDFKQTEHQ